MTGPQWTYQLVDLMGGEPLAEVPISGASYRKSLNRAGNFAGTIHLDDRLARRGIDFYDVTTPCRRGIYVLRDGQPQWGGIIWTRTYSSQERTIELGAADWWSYFDHRIVLKLLANDLPVDHVATTSVEYRDVEQNELARELVRQAQAHSGGDIGITFDDSTSGIWRDRTYYGYELKPTGEALSQLAGVLYGPDMMFDVGIDPSTGRVTRLLRLGDPYLGQQGSPHVWEFGGNLVSYEWPSDGASMATRTFASGDGIDQGTPIAVSEDTARYSAGWPLLDAEHGYSTVSTPAVLQAHADADQRASRLPVVTPALTVRGDMEPRIGAYGPGDDARVIIRDPFHARGLDVYLRIVDIEVEPGDEAGAQATLTMAPLLETAGIY